MIGTLYRYPHPHDPMRFIYVGQGPKRHKDHRSGRSSFGRRFKKLFPDDILPQPTRELIEVSDSLELNEEETIWMFRYHTWQGYPDGMNLTLPGSTDYKKLITFMPHDDKVRGGRLGGLKTSLIPGHLVKAGQKSFDLHGSPTTVESCRKGGKIQGLINAQNGHMSTIGKEWGRKAVESGQINSIRTPQSCAAGGRAGGRKAYENRSGIHGRTIEQRTEDARKGGKKAGSRTLQNKTGIHGIPQKQHLENCRKGGEVSGRKSVESGHMDRIRSLVTPEIMSENGRVVSCLRWNIRRGKSCTCGKHIKVTEA